MKKELLRRFRVLVDAHGFFNDLQVCPCGFETLGGFDAEALTAELFERADNGKYDEDNCNYRVFKWVERAIKISEQLIGTREGDVSREEIYETVRALYPEYEKKDAGFKEAGELLRGKIKKMIASSLEAKRHFLVFPENPQRWNEVHPFFEGYQIDGKQLSRALWAYSDGFNKIDKSHAENRAELDAFFTVYLDFCYDGARTALKDNLRRYNDALRKLEIAALSDNMVKKLAEIGEAPEPHLSRYSMNLAKALYFDALELEKGAFQILKKAYTPPDLKRMIRQGYKGAGESNTPAKNGKFRKIQPLIIPFSVKNGDALIPADIDAPKIDSTNWEASYADGREAYEFIIAALHKNSEKREAIAKQLSNEYFIDAGKSTAYFFGF